MGKFLKRFEKLENVPKSAEAECVKISKRFERLEVGNKRIEVAITDKITEDEKAPSHIVYYILCPYCGKDNVAQALTCKSCNHDLTTKLAENYQRIVHLLKKCTVCKTMNLKERPTCWVCGKNFFESARGEQVLNTEFTPADSSNEIILNIDGKEYKSTDDNLPMDIKELMERIRRYGYNKEMVEEWIKLRNNAADISNEEEKLQILINGTRLTEIRWSLFWRVLGLTAMVIFIIIQFRACSGWFGTTYNIR